MWTSDGRKRVFASYITALERGFKFELNLASLRLARKRSSAFAKDFTIPEHGEKLPAL
jgi:1-aminocyclopropane-1-carboxylate deaminase/D-cysteine desulfhydrase-like pyridoxal-dependent ACC family enzyme